jgi:hypothetical protein
VGLSTDKRTPQERSAAVYVELFSSLRTLVWALCIAFCGYCAVLIARAFAGHITHANVAMRFVVGGFAHFGTAKFAWPISFGSVGYALLERRERRRKTGKLAKRIAELERMLDPTRTSSELTATGQTRKEDK